MYKHCHTPLHVGTKEILPENTALLTMDTSQVNGEVDACNKDTGGKKITLQKWSRALHHFVRGGGIIDKFDALFM